MKVTNKYKNIAGTGQEKYTEDCILHYLEVPKLEGTPEKEIEKWLYFIADEKARIAYQQRSMFLHDQANYIYTARKEGLEEGREEGREEGKGWPFAVTNQ